MRRSTVAYPFARIPWLLLFSGLSFGLIPGGKWIWMNPLPQGNRLLAVDFPSPDVGYAAGEDGALLKTTDAGTNWKAMADLPAEDFTMLRFPDENHGYLAGNYSLLRTSDGGGNWSRVITPLYARPSSIQATDAQTLYLLNGADSLLRSRDGGTNWLGSPIQKGTFFEDLSFPAPDTGFALSDSGIFKTTNGGTTWVRHKYDFASNPASVLYFLDTRHGYAVGNSGHAYRTDDGGATWTDRGRTRINRIYSVRFTSPDTGFLAGDTSSNFGLVAILKTVDGGRDWSPVSPPGLTTRFNSIAFTGSRTGYAVGDTGIILKTFDGGDSWSMISTAVTTEWLHDARFLDSATGIAVGGINLGTDIILKTGDGGRTWSSYSLPKLGGFLSIAFATPRIAVAAGLGGSMARTRDGGDTWEDISTSMNDYRAAIVFPSAAIGFTAGAGICKSTDSGATWIHQSVPTRETLYSIFFPDTLNGFAVGDNGTILHTSNGGALWEIQTSGLTWALNSVWFSTPEKGFAAGGPILKTLDGGKHWDSIPNAAVDGLSSIRFLDSKIGFALGSDDILETQDGGETWEAMACPTRNGLSSIIPIDRDYAYAVGRDGVILKLIPDNASNARPPIRASRGQALMRNGTVAYALESAARVRLSAFDARGRRLAVLLDETEPAGPHGFRLPDAFRRKGLILVLESKGVRHRFLP
ncbi:MAG: hypothetical protein JF616_19575 [Fibrobacteres bacterium]|nr:hypothetical protein [Fibrobacterota bacterium]